MAFPKPKLEVRNGQSVRIDKLGRRFPVVHSYDRQTERAMRSKGAYSAPAKRQPIAA